MLYGDTTKNMKGFQKTFNRRELKKSATQLTLEYHASFDELNDWTAKYATSKYTQTGRYLALKMSITDAGRSRTHALKLRRGVRIWRKNREAGKNAFSARYDQDIEGSDCDFTPLSV